MRMHGMRPLLLMSFLAAAASAAYPQGLYWESTAAGDVAGGATQVSRSYMMPKLFKHDAGNMILLVRMDRGMFYSLDPQKKTYWEMTFTEMENLLNQASSAMMEALQKVPVEQRKMVEESMRGMMGGASAPVVVSATGEKRAVSGYPCAEYVATQDGATVFTAWTTRSIPGYEVIGRDFLEAQKRLYSTNRQFGSAMAEAMAKLDGFPMEMEVMGSKTVVTRVEQRAIPVSEFEVPAGYSKTDSPLQQMIR